MTRESGHFILPFSFLMLLFSPLLRWIFLYFNSKNMQKINIGNLEGAKERGIISHTVHIDPCTRRIIDEAGYEIREDEKEILLKYLIKEERKKIEQFTR